MALIVRSIRHNLARVADFSGRETNGEFWPYAIGLFLVSMVVGMLVLVPVLFDMFARIERYVAEHPEGLPNSPGPSGQQTLPPELMLDMSSTMVPLAIANLVFVLLLAAAVVRRLHDRDKSGWWAALPLPFMIYGEINRSAATKMVMGGAPSDPALMLPSALNSLFYWIALIVLIIMLVQEGNSGPNRYGPSPSRSES